MSAAIQQKDQPPIFLPLGKTAEPDARCQAVSTYAQAHMNLILLPPMGGPLEFDATEFAFPQDVLERGQMATLLQDTLPAIQADFPPWVIWAYEVNENLKKVAPRLANEWCKNFMQLRVYHEMLQGSCFGFPMSPLNLLIDHEQAQQDVQNFHIEIKKLANLIGSQHLKRDPERVQLLFSLLEKANFVFLQESLPWKMPSSENQNVQKELCLLAEFLLNLGDFHKKTEQFNMKRLFSDSSKKHAEESTKIYPSLIACAADAFTTMRNAAQKAARLYGINGLRTQKDHNLHIGYLSDTDDLNILAVGMTCLHRLQIFYALFQQRIKFLWPADQLEDWEFVRETIVPQVMFILQEERALVDELARLILTCAKDLSYEGVHPEYFLAEAFKMIQQVSEKLIVSSELNSLFWLLSDGGGLYEVLPELLKASGEANQLDIRISDLKFLRYQLLAHFQRLFLQLPVEFLQKNREAILEAVYAFHENSSLPLAAKYILLCRVYELSNSAFQIDTNPIIDFLGFLGIKQILDKAIKSKLAPVHKAFVPPPEPQMAHLPPATTHQYSKTGDAVATPSAPKREPKAKKPPQKAPEKATSQSKLQHEELQLEEEFGQYRYTPQEREKVEKMLTDVGFVTKRVKKHAILKHPLLPKPFALPTHGDTLSRGVAHEAHKAAIAAQRANLMAAAGGAAAAAGAGQEQQDDND